MPSSPSRSYANHQRAAFSIELRVETDSDGKVMKQALSAFRDVRPLNDSATQERMTWTHNVSEQVASLAAYLPVKAGSLVTRNSCCLKFHHRLGWFTNAHICGCFRLRTIVARL
jgi:hypothetical protein